MDDIKTALVGNAKEYYKNAVDAEARKEYNTAVTLFFKALSALCDLYILENLKIVPSSHANRFRILEEKFPEVYKIIDKDFPFYQNSYNSRLNEEVSLMFREDVEKLSNKLKISL